MALVLLLFFSALALVFGTLSEGWSVLAIGALVLISSLIINRLVFKRYFGLTTALMLGCYLYGYAWINDAVAHRLPLNLDKTQAVLTAQVEQVDIQDGLQRLTLKIVDVEALERIGLPALRKVRLNYFHPKLTVNSNDTIQVTAVLRSPHSLLNGLAFDYEVWLLGQGIDATGYIKAIELVRAAQTSDYRQQLLAHFKRQVSEQQWPWLAGLVFGEQQSFNDEQWRLAKETGTLHLLVVSGMHMGLIVFLSLLFWGLVNRLQILISRRSIVSIALWRTGFLLAISSLYLWLAGAGIALQRAWIMLAVVLVLMNLRFHFNWLLAIASALLLVLVINPVVWLSAGFSYSFMAVLALLLFFSGRKNQSVETLWLPQWVVFLTMLPLFLYWQQPTSLMQCIANLVAIPMLSFILMPLTLATLLLPDIGQGEWLVWCGELFWQWLSLVRQLPINNLLYLPTSSLIIWPVWLWVIYWGANYWLARVALLLVVGAVFLFPHQQTSQATMIDIGQGQSLVFTTQASSLVYDAGPAVGGFDSGDSLVRPVLYRLGVKHLDTLIISHQDNDHAGGTQALLNSFVVHDWLVGEELPGVTGRPNFCRDVSSSWQVLDPNMQYRVLNIADEDWARLPDTHNNRSCVVQLVWYGHKFLLVGDIAQPIEFELIRQYGSELKSDILVLGHHGSKTSSSSYFLRTVKPEQVWISAGFNNRFNHPSPEVIERLEQLAIPWLNTGQVGQVWMVPNGQYQTMRNTWQPPWRNH